MGDLSKYVNLSEVTTSVTAKRHGVNNTPNETQKASLKLVCESLFDKVREHFNVPIFISSGFRCEKLNTLVGGSKTSQHRLGEALDIDAYRYGGITNKQIFDYIKGNLHFDQMIWEFGTNENPEWIHISYRAKGNRNSCLKAKKINGKTIYENI
jgi:zinc D-Ala-D-Ala carboxypeptidase